MYIHLGGDVLIKRNIIVAIIDLELEKLGKTNQTFLENMKIHHKKIRYLCKKGREKTMIVTNNDLFFSPISSITLFKRSFMDIGNNSFELGIEVK
ncbi:extracellular matrix regulator RemB [Desulfosporosinus sp.]|uniref:extracellular matrix regulator RemB n=1 Tax=Desulfosporosinus sp. TaxID=157907 RepID=UPI0025B9B46C|nr:extracellular matrix/biofilm biosynthesis regulator RemA family protein [Desulfosporosinus sp.]MBC2727884.1 DUF370 domain-containing protein [Desulfosporosinus sp.]